VALPAAPVTETVHLPETLAVLPAAAELAVNAKASMVITAGQRRTCEIVIAILPNNGNEFQKHTNRSQAFTANKTAQNATDKRRTCGALVSSHTLSAQFRS
jgi:hypothetical protein